MKLSMYQTILPMALTQQTDDSQPNVISLFDHMSNLDLGLALEHQPSPIGLQKDLSESSVPDQDDDENEVGNQIESATKNVEATDDGANIEPNVQDLALVLNNLNISTSDPVDTNDGDLYDLSDLEDGIGDLGIARSRKQKPKRKGKKQKHVPKEIIELNSCTIGAYDCQENAECKTLYNDLHEGKVKSESNWA